MTGARYGLLSQFIFSPNKTKKFRSSSFPCNFAIPASILLRPQLVMKNIWGIPKQLGNYRSSHRRCFFLKVFLKFLRISQESTCVGVSF